MLDIFLLKPLSEELEVTLNDLISMDGDLQTKIMPYSLMLNYQV